MWARRVVVVLLAAVVAGGSVYAIHRATAQPRLASAVASQNDSVGTVFYSGEGCAGLAQASAAVYRLRETSLVCVPGLTGGTGIYNGRWTDDSRCDPTHAMFPKVIHGTIISQLVGYSLGRLGPVYFLETASALRRAQIHTIVLLDPGTLSEFRASCDTAGRTHVSERIKQWLLSNSHAHLVVVGGRLTADDGGKNKYQGIADVYLRGESSSVLASQVFLCTAAPKYAGHDAVEHYLSLIARSIESCPAGTSRITGIGESTAPAPPSARPSPSTPPDTATRASAPAAQASSPSRIAPPLSSTVVLPSSGPSTSSAAPSRSTSHEPITVWYNYSPADAGHAMCRGNPGRPESMPGGVVSQGLTAPEGVSALTGAKVQIDPDASVTASLTLYVNGEARASAAAKASGDTSFDFGPVPVNPGDRIMLKIGFTADYGKIITVYTAPNSSGEISISNSCSDGAPNYSSSTDSLRAVLYGLS